MARRMMESQKSSKPRASIGSVAAMNRSHTRLHKARNVMNPPRDVTGSGPRTSPPINMPPVPMQGDEPMMEPDIGPADLNPIDGNKQQGMGGDQYG